ncbi:hypothetical protein [Streptomyces sp. FH025]|uniref:hypothetical protein n=1 Tax=Streptomyces sp. FH025 TaxID=2815937 RepID=UPI001A9F1E47|nr:hypothetical protein [Streptomyces sp. FH025]MBO1417384.1 hypothetical protein [Streptomyces sp. FH025]
MNNLDFSDAPLFSWYVVALAVSGVIMLVIGAVGGGLKVGLRIVNVLIGLGFLGYAYYLTFVFEGGTYYILTKLFFLPVALIIYSVKEIIERSKAKKQPNPLAAPYLANAQQAPYNPNAPHNPNAPYNPNAPQAGRPAAPQAASPYQPGVPAQPVADNPYAQPVPPAQPGQPQHPAG